MRQVVHPRPQTPLEESDAKPETLMLIIPTTVCKYDIKKVHGNQSNPFLKKNVSRRKYFSKVDNIIDQTNKKIIDGIVTHRYQGLCF